VGGGDGACSRLAERIGMLKIKLKNGWMHDWQIGMVYGVDLSFGFFHSRNFPEKLLIIM
jgi:hypothetical protein